MRPAWLPNELSLDGNWESILGKLYKIFEVDFIQGHPNFDDKQVWWDKRKLDGHYEEGFWHIISTTGPNTQDRIPDFERARRLPWCAPTILNHTDRAVKYWDYLESKGEIRTYVWLVEWDYIVILKKRKMKFGEVAFLITAYYISGNNTRKKLEEKYKKRVNSS